MERYIIFEKDTSALDKFDEEEQLILDRYKNQIPRLLKTVWHYIVTY